MKIEKYSSHVRNDKVAKDWHDAVCLRGVTSIRHRWKSPYGFKNYKNGKTFVKKVEFPDKDEWEILSAS